MNEMLQIANSANVDWDTAIAGFISDGRIYSSDSNLNWRFQIWQDVIEDMQEKNIFVKGYGFNEKIP